MTRVDRPVSVALLLGVLSMTAEAEDFDSKLKSYMDARATELEEISEERKAELSHVAKYVQSKVTTGQLAQLTFICTHNSRRSHLSQLWAAAAAQYYNIDKVQTFSGGTEATEFNPRAVAALQRSGMLIESEQRSENPRYLVRFSESTAPQICFSKVYDDKPNPTQNYCAVMTCSQADAACPVVSGAEMRIAIPYEDPKVADNTAEESEKYDERSAQIAREMLYVFSQVRN